MEPTKQTKTGMVDLGVLIGGVLEKNGSSGGKNSISNAFCFLADNGFFDVPWEEAQSSLLLPEEGAKGLEERLHIFMAHCEQEEAEKLVFLKSMLAERFPETMERPQCFQEACDKEVYQLYDFMAAYLKKEVHLMNNRELGDFIKRMDSSTSKMAVQRFANFSNWMIGRDGVSHTASFHVENRVKSCATMAYSVNLIVAAFYHIFTDENNYASPGGENGTEEAGMMQKACDSPKYADTYLYLSIHLICALRDPDIFLLPLPTVSNPGDVLERIRNNTLTDGEAVDALHSIMERIGYLAPRPNKTQSRSQVPSLSFFIPRTLEPHFGRLFLIARAQCLTYKKEFLDQKVTGYWQLREIMTGEIAELFRERDISPTAFSKSFMQGLSIQPQGEGSFLKRAMLGYQLAARARSHKGGYGLFAETTAIYLQDNALTGLTGSMIARELFDRGILSSIPAMLLSLVSQGTFDDLTFTQQTRLIQELGLDALEIEKVMSVFMEARAKARETITQLLGKPSFDRAEGIRSLLHNLAAGAAPGKDEDVACFMIALDKPCPYACRKHCLGCRFRIDTRATLFHLKGELKRVAALKKQAEGPGEKLKYRLILTQYIIPSIKDVLSVAAGELGEEAAEYIGMLLTSEEDENLYGQEQEGGDAGS